MVPRLLSGGGAALKRTHEHETDLKFQKNGLHVIFITTSADVDILVLNAWAECYTQADRKN